MKRSTIATRSTIALLALLCGCAGPSFPRDELPSAPIVALYRDAETARRRAELLAKPDERRDRAGVARLDDLQRMTRLDPREVMSDVAGRLVEIDPRTGTVTPLGVAPRGADFPRWSNDRARLVFLVFDDAFPVLHELDRASGVVRRNPAPLGVQGQGAPGPDGRLASVIAERDGAKLKLRIHLTDAGGIGGRIVTNGPSDRSPALSPDGSLLAFVAQDAGGLDSVALLDLTRPDATARPIARGKDPIFTPDGRTIVYSARVRSGWRLFKVRPDGTGRLPIGVPLNDQTDELQPSVSPDGRFVVYVAESKQRQTLRVRRFDGSADREVLDSGDAASPAW